ncbi:MAG: cupredoxin domain-containing protein [Candidatus Nanoarchaeia archaeon]
MLDQLLKKSWMPFSIRVVGVILFLLLMFLLFIGTIEVFSIKLSSKLAMFLIWILWWPLLYITLIFVGRLWCGFICPLGLANEAGNYVRKGRTINLIRWGFIPFVIFFLVVYLEQISGLFVSANITLAFITAFFMAAFIFGILFSRSLFCMIICPIGTIIRVFSRLSLLGVRPDPKVCAKCKTFDCIKGRVASKCPMFINIPKNKSNALCLMCTNCIKNCPHGSAKLRFVKPGKEILDKVKFVTSESIFIIALLALTTLLTTNGNLIYRTIVPTPFTGALLRLIDFSAAISIFIASYLLITYLTTLISKQDFRTAVKEYGYVYLPMAFFIMFFTITFDFLGPSLNMTELAKASIKYVLLTIGMLWSIFILFKFTIKFTKKLSSGILHLFFIVGLGLAWLTLLIPGPLNLYPELGGTVIVNPGDAVEITSYSMGYDPSTIIVQKGVQVTMKITNKDVTHAIDINEFNVHKVLKGGRMTTVNFVPDKTGEFKLYCSIPGHEEAGMKAKLIVKDKID